MTTLHHTCSDCDSEFKIKYDEESVEDRPTYCPFCSSYIIEDEEEIEDDDE
jgi:DNA-directed RNA polymerase subunit RPC12/RpoP